MLQHPERVEAGINPVELGDEVFDHFLQPANYAELLYFHGRMNEGFRTLANPGRQQRWPSVIDNAETRRLIEKGRQLLNN